jgi:lysophospholipase L1-like esterase
MLNSNLKIAPGSKLVMIGDSVTDCGRARPFGDGLHAIGDGYVRNVASLLALCAPEHRIRVINVGTSGHTIRDLAGRWQTDVLDLKPDWLSVMIGINDVWRQFDSPLQVADHVLLPEYEATLYRLVEMTLPTTKGLILMSPFYIEDNPEDAMRARMDQYGNVVKAVAEKSGAIFVDTQAAFVNTLRHVHSSYVAWDRVHPNSLGHMALAKAFLDAIGFEWS